MKWAVSCKAEPCASFAYCMHTDAVSLQLLLLTHTSSVALSILYIQTPVTHIEIPSAFAIWVYSCGAFAFAVFLLGIVATIWKPEQGSGTQGPRMSPLSRRTNAHWRKFSLQSWINKNKSLLILPVTSFSEHCAYFKLQSEFLLNDFTGLKSTMGSSESAVERWLLEKERENN